MSSEASCPSDGSNELPASSFPAAEQASPDFSLWTRLYLYRQIIGRLLARLRLLGRIARFHAHPPRGWNRLARRAAEVLLAAGLMLGGVPPAFASGPAFTEQTGTANPLNLSVGRISAPTFADIDGDGDLDAFIGHLGGTILYYKNTGTRLAPSFTEQTGTGNPFNGLNVGSDSTPAFADIDGDGDLDLFSGENGGTIKYYKNTGTRLVPVFTEQTGADNPFNGVGVGHSSIPAFADIDGDGDQDAFIGEADGFVNYFKNTGTPLAPVFAEQTGAANPFNSVDVGFLSTPAFADIDGDGDLDAFIGEMDGVINYYKNTGTRLAPVFAAQTGAANPFAGVNVGNNSAPAFADIDGDGDLDAFIGEKYGFINYYKNTGANTITTPSFTELTGTTNPFSAVDVLLDSAPAFVDIDGDGDLDAFVGNWYGHIAYYQNTGTPLAPNFVLKTDSDNPLNTAIGRAPAFADIDGDGDLDAFIGDYDNYGGFIRYYKNTGTPRDPAFTLQTETDTPPFYGVAFGDYGPPFPAFADIDADGDLDAFIGDDTGVVNYYKNNGTALVPAFVRQTGADNPFDGVTVWTYTAPAFADIDADGDLDAFIGNAPPIRLFYYENIGTRVAPVFTEGIGTDNPLTGVSVRMSRPAFADIDADGDPDIFIGGESGAVRYWMNTHASFASESFTSIAAGNVLQFGTGESKLFVKVNTLGTLTELAASCTAGNHPNASTSGLQTGVYWNLTPNAGAAGFNLGLTLPFKTPDANDMLCRYTGSGWDCAQTSRTATDVTRTGVTDLSDWVVGNDVGPTAVELRSFSARTQDQPGWAAGLGLAAANLLAALGALVTRRRRRRT